MVFITTPSNLRLFISGNFITVAKGFSQTISFGNDIPVTLPDSVDQLPPSVSISAAATSQAISSIAQAVRLSDSYTETLVYTYEVIEPKVVYERIDKSNCIRFVDVTAKSTHSHVHTIPVINTTWMTNPALNRGRVIVERLDESTGNWVVVASVPLNGSSTVCNLPETTCTYRTRYEYRQVVGCGGTSPLLFEAIGQSFPLAAYYYEERNPYIEYITAEKDNKYVWCREFNFLTLETGINYEIKFNSYNIGYIYTYNESFLDPEIPDLVYNPITLQWTGSVPNPILPTTVMLQFNGCRNEFINGILTEGSACGPLGVPLPAEYSCEYSDEYLTACGEEIFIEEMDQFTVEVIQPDIIEPSVQDPCTYCLTIQDATFTYNPCITNGFVYYEYKNSTDPNAEWCEIKGSPFKSLDTFRQCFCSPGTYVIRNKYKVVHTKRCGCTVTVETLFETEWYEHVVTVEDYKPRFELEGLDCCYVINQTYQLVPTILEPNNFNCPLSETTHIPTLEYRLYKWSMEQNIWILQEDRTQLYEILPIIILENYPFEFNLPEKGRYKLEAILENCCGIDSRVIKEYIFDTCGCFEFKQECNTSWVAESDKDSCNCRKYILTNYCSEELTVTIKSLIGEEWKITDTKVIAPYSSIDYIFTDDGLYTFELSENEIYLIYVFCVINECYTNLIKEVLCSTEDNCKCETTRDIEKRYNLNKIQALYQTWMRFIEYDYYLHSRYNIVDITGRLQEFMENKDLYNKILKFCKPCGEKFKSLGDCGC